MARKRLNVDWLKVESFSTSAGGTAVAEREAGVREVRNEEATGDYSCGLDNTTACDTEGHCSTWCIAPTNVCEVCG